MRTFLIICLALVVTLTFALKAVGLENAAEHVFSAQKTVEIPIRWIVPMRNALVDFRRKRPDTWTCYTVYASVDQAGFLDVTFGSPPAERAAGDNTETLGDAGRCGPTLIYTMDKKGRIKSVRGLR